MRAEDLQQCRVAKLPLRPRIEAGSSTWQADKLTPYAFSRGTTPGSAGKNTEEERKRKEGKRRKERASPGVGGCSLVLDFGGSPTPLWQRVSFVTGTYYIPHDNIVDCAWIIIGVLVAHWRHSKSGPDSTFVPVQPSLTWGPGRMAE